MRTFVVEGLRRSREVGAIAPSSRRFARSMARSVRRSTSPKRVLEVGPGTGAITREILPWLNDGDELHLVEVNPSFCRHLEERLLRRYRQSRPGVEVVMHEGSITAVPLEGKFDAVVCALPFRKFSPEVVRIILDRLADLGADHGEITFMQYVGMRQLLAPFVSRSRRFELRRIDGMCRSRMRSHGGSRELVLLNIPPSFVVRFSVDGGEGSDKTPSPSGAGVRAAAGRARREP